MSADTLVNLVRYITSWSFKSTSKEDLIEGLVISVKDRDRPENPHGEVGDSVVDRLLLRYLSSGESYSTQQNTSLSPGNG